MESANPKHSRRVRRQTQNNDKHKKRELKMEIKPVNLGERQE